MYPLTNFYGRPSLFSNPSAFFPQHWWFPHWPKGGVVHLCWSHSAVRRHCMQITIVTDYRWQTKVTITPTNNRPVIIENVWFSGLVLSQIEVSGTTGLSYTVFMRAVLTKGYMGDYWRQWHQKTMPSSVLWGERVFSQRPRGDQVNWATCFVGYLTSTA